MTAFVLDEATLAPRVFAAPAPYMECLLFETAAESVAVEAFDRLVAVRLPEQYRAADAVVFAPEGESWRVADLDPVLRSLSLAPLCRKMLCLVSAHLMDRSLLDSLLKSIEEPSASTTLVVSAPSAAALPATLRSRLSDVLSPKVHLPADFLPRLDACRVPRALAARHDLHDLLVLLLAVPDPGSVLATAELTAPAPLVVANWASAVESVLKTAALPAPVLKRLRPRLLRLFADIHLARVSEDASVLSADLAGVFSAAAMLDESSRNGSNQVPYLTVLASALSALPGYGPATSA